MAYKQKSGGLPFKEMGGSPASWHKESHKTSLRDSIKGLFTNIKKGDPIFGGSKGQIAATTEELEAQQADPELYTQPEQEVAVEPVPEEKTNLGVEENMSFKQAFRTARNTHGGKGGIFTWKGKKYGTRLGTETE